jgi:hypothetical protein
LNAFFSSLLIVPCSTGNGRHQEGPDITLKIPLENEFKRRVSVQENPSLQCQSRVSCRNGILAEKAAVIDENIVVLYLHAC